MDFEVEVEVDILRYMTERETKSLLIGDEVLRVRGDREQSRRWWYTFIYTPSAL